MGTKTHIYTNERIDNFILPTHIKGKKYYLYVHTRVDNGEIFYFGIGTMDRNKYYYRSVCGKKRNIIWKRIVNKTKFKVFIIDESDNKQDILNKEIFYINLIGKKKDCRGTLANITDGGEGLKGHKVIWTKEMREAASVRIKKRVIKDSTREKHRLNIIARGMVGRYGRDNPTSKTTLQINPETLIIEKEFESAKAAAIFLGVKPQSITNAIKKGKKSKGFLWRYENAS